MQIGCSVPTSGPLTGVDTLTRIAHEAEMLGFDYVTVSDHILDCSIITTSEGARDGTKTNIGDSG